MNYYYVRREFLRKSDLEDQAGTMMTIYTNDNTTGRPTSLRPFRSHSQPNDAGGSQATPRTPQPDQALQHQNQSGENRYDFYLAVAKKDLEAFGIPFCKMVETRMGMRPCLAIRDMLPGGPKYESMAEVLEIKCGGKVVFVVSKNFYDSDECQFLVHFAKTLDPFALHKKLIPLVIDKNVKLPRVLEGLVTISYNAAVRENWLGKRLWDAIHGPQPACLRRFSSPAP